MASRFEVRRVVLSGVVALALLVGFGASAAGRIWTEVDRVDLDDYQSPGLVAAERPSHPGETPDLSSSVPDDGRTDTGVEAHRAIETPPTTPSAIAANPGMPEPEAITSPDASLEKPRTVLLVGSDSRDGVEDLGDFGGIEGARADVMMVAYVSAGNVGLLSIPRDLAVQDTCRGGIHRLGEALAGCDGDNGLAHLVHEVEAVLDIEIDHVASVDLDGFQHVVDRVGGYEICLDHPIRDDEAHLALEAGCHIADGRTTLAYLRSRHTERLVDGHWEPVPAVSDLVRNERQSRFMLDLFDRLGHETSLTDLMMISGDLAPYLTVDDRFSFVEMARLAWSMRHVQPELVSIPVVDSTIGGAAMLEATTDPAEVADELQAPRAEVDSGAST